MAWVTIHVRRNRRRTTVSMQEVLASLLSLQLCGKVDISAVARWCQQRIDEDPGAYISDASQRLASQAILAIAPKGLEKAYWDHVLAAQPAKKLTRPRRSRRRAG